MKEILTDGELTNILAGIVTGDATFDDAARLRHHSDALRAENERLGEALREIESRTGHFGEAPPPPEWMPMLSLIAWVGRTARAALPRPGAGKEGERG